MIKTTFFVFVLMGFVYLSQLFGQYSNKTVVITSSISNIDVIVDGEVIGKTPFRKTFFTDSDTLLLQVAKEGYLTKDYILDFSNRTEHTIRVKLTKGPKSRKTAVTLSTIIPGSGQIYSGRFLSGFALGGLTFGALMVSIKTQQSYTSAKNEYLDAKQNYEENLFLSSFSSLYLEMQSKYSTMEDKYRKKNIFFALTAVVWAYNIADCHIRFPGEKNVYLSFITGNNYSRISLTIKL